MVTACMAQAGGAQGGGCQPPETRETGAHS